ncbi:rod shape-determining protein MreC [Halomonas cibimaris]
MFADQHFTRMETLRAQLSTVVAPVQWVVSVPSDLLSWGTVAFSEQQALMEENRRLRENMLTLSRRAQRMASLQAENAELRRLLDAAQKRDIAYMTAELISLDSDPFSQRMVVDRGRRNGAYVGQPVIDATGVVGQVTSVSAYSSRVILLADASHALPIRVNRNGLRFIVQGTGRYGTVKVLHVPDTADIREGDLLTTSGLAERFPKGYPVARVTEVFHDPGQPFARVTARPLARLERSRHFLMLFPPPPKSRLPSLGGDGLAISETALGSAYRVAAALESADALRRP